MNRTITKLRIPAGIAIAVCLVAPLAHAQKLDDEITMDVVDVIDADEKTLGARIELPKTAAARARERAAFGLKTANEEQPVRNLEKGGVDELREFDRDSEWDGIDELREFDRDSEWDGIDELREFDRDSEWDRVDESRQTIQNVREANDMEPGDSAPDYREPYDDDRNPRDRDRDRPRRRP